MLESEMDIHLDYEKNSVAGNNSGNSRNGKYPKKFKRNMVSLSYLFPVIVMVSLNL